MIRYRNLVTRRVYDRPEIDEAMESSSGWERLEEPLQEETEAHAEDKQEEEK